MKHIPVLLVTFLALVGVALLFIADESQGQPQQTSSSLVIESKIIYGNSESSLPSSLSPLAASFYPEKAELSNDQDHDGKPDGMADSLAMLALGFIVVLSIGFVLKALVGGRLLLACCESPKLSSIWLGVLERPG